MILAVSNLRAFSAMFFNELCLAAAREVVGYDAPEHEVQMRAFLIQAFHYDWLSYPSRLAH